MGERRGLYRVDKPEGKRPLKRPRSRRRNMKMYIQETELGGVGRRTRIICLWIRTRGGLV
jgi:hypothetical protein